MNSVVSTGPLLWGICSAGRISNDFVTALNMLSKSDHIISAVAARDVESSRDFAQRHNISKHYPNYDALFQDPEVEVIYIGSINPMHLPLAKGAISAGKHVLCEKPLCMNVKETEELIQLAKARKVFLMEGIWSRCFPAYEKILQALVPNGNSNSNDVRGGRLGEVLQVQANLGYPLANIDNCRLKSLGGGSILNIGIYCVQLAIMVFGRDQSPDIRTGGHLNQDGVDESLSITLVYPNGKTATLISHNRVLMPNEAVIVGTKGSLKIPDFVSPTELIFDDEIVTFELPEVKDANAKFNYPKSEALAYEAEEVRRCIRKGLTESPKIPLNESLLVAKIMETARKQVGVSYPQDL